MLLRLHQTIHTTTRLKPYGLMCGREFVDLDCIRSSVSDIATDEFAAELMSGAHNDETASGRVDHEITRSRDCLDQGTDQPNGLDVRMQLAIDLLRPAIGNCRARPPCRSRLYWWLLQ